MDNLHSMLRSFGAETKSSRDHLTVFREFLAHLDRAQRKAPAAAAARAPRAKAQTRRKPAKRSRKG
jgi:hypothetical protein